MKKQLVHIGTIGKPHGVHGQVRIYSNLENFQDMETYGELLDDHGESWTLSWKNAPVAVLYDGKGNPVNSRSAVEQLINRKLYVPRTAFPQPEEDEFYLIDLMGLEARIYKDEQDTAILETAILGKVHKVHDYGAGASLELKLENGELVIVPFTKACVPEIDIKAGWLKVCLPHEIEVSSSKEKRAS